MKMACRTLAIVACFGVSSLSADHESRDVSLEPSYLAYLLHVQSQSLAEEIDYHYAHFEWPHHQMDRISRLVVSAERNVVTGRPISAWLSLLRIEAMLDSLDSYLRRSVSIDSRAHARHIRQSVQEMKEVAELLEHSLQHASPQQGSY